MDPSIQQRIQSWLEGPFDQKTKEEIHRLQASNLQALADAFYTDLSFGTGGLRGLMGVGPNRMNIYTVRRATQGLASYLKKQFPKISISVLIGFDSRHHSHEFAQEAASVLTANGIHVFLLKEIRPTPYVSFACRYHHCQAAIMITASHNPKEYNGYKVYWQDGAQVVHPHDTGIMQEIESTAHFQQIPKEPKASCEIVDTSLDLAYLEAIAPLQHFPNLAQKEGKDLKIVYTSLHGTGITIVPKALADWGFTSLLPVEKQVIPDGDFPTVHYPNPEYREALSLGIQLLENSQSDILLATDPDADRLAIVAMHHNKPIPLNGNETASLCVEYLCTILKDKMPPKPAFVTTIVSSDLIPTICEHFGVHCEKVLTGFKYIGEKIHDWEQQSSYSFVFGAEESYGYLMGTHARDKDAIISSCLLAEMALYCKKQSKTLIDFLYATYQKYGIFREKQDSLEFTSGKEGMETMQSWMESLRNSPPKEICGQPITSIEDYQQLLKKDLLLGTQTPLFLPKSNVLLFRLANDSKLVIRPSGTEPKLKIYAGVRQKDFVTIEEGIRQADLSLETLLQALRSLFHTP